MSEVEVVPGVYMTVYKKKDEPKSHILEEFLQSNDVSWLRFELNKISLSVLLLEDTNLQLVDIEHEDAVYADVIVENSKLLLEKRLLIMHIEDRIKQVSTSATWTSTPATTDDGPGVYL